MSSSDRDSILSRRAAFVAAALAGLGISTAPATAAAQVGGGGGASIGGGGVAGSGVGGSGGAGGELAPPQPCLSTEGPQACLCACRLSESFDARPGAVLVAAGLIGAASRRRKRRR